MKAKLKYPPLAELMALSVRECHAWCSIRDIEQEVGTDGSIGAYDRMLLVQERTQTLRDEQHEVQVKSRTLKQEIIELIKEESGLADDTDPK